MRQCDTQNICALTERVRLSVVESFGRALIIVPMLILSRLVGQSIIIGDQLYVVTVVSVTGEESVHLGIAAPKEVKIQRAETLKDRRIKNEGSHT
jgi:carbon storage regulator CsrA